MVKGMQVKVLRAFPKEAKRRTGMHPDTKRMIDSLGTTKGKIVSFEFSSPQDAKNRANALSRARKRGDCKLPRIPSRGQNRICPVQVGRLPAFRTLAGGLLERLNWRRSEKVCQVISFFYVLDD